MKVGIDLVDIDRFKNKPKSFYEKIFTENEFKYCKSFSKPEEHFAGFFAVKEAVMKALGVGIDSIPMHDIEVLHDENRPYVKLTNKAKEFLDKLVLFNIEISISHTDKLATAICNIFK